MPPSPKRPSGARRRASAYRKTSLRTLCARGELKHTQMGKKSLIYWPNLLELLERGTPQEETPVVYGKIRRIAE